MVCVYIYMYSYIYIYILYTYVVWNVVLVDGLRVRGRCRYIYVFIVSRIGTSRRAGKARSCGGWTEMD